MNIGSVLNNGRRGRRIVMPELACSKFTQHTLHATHYTLHKALVWFFSPRLFGVPGTIFYVNQMLPRNAKRACT